MKINDRCILDLEEVKQELLSEASNCRAEFDQALADEYLSEEVRLDNLKYTSHKHSVLLNFLTNNMNITVRDEYGAMFSYTGYFISKMIDVKQKIRKERGEV